MGRPRKGEKTALQFLLSGLIPYTRENLLLSFHPHKFFNELEKISGFSRQTLKNASQRAQREGLIEREGKLLKITEKGKQKLQPFRPTKLHRNVHLMVIFDIPESEAHVRRRLRLLLREWQFKQVQKSVWVSDFDYRKDLADAIKELRLEECVQVFESARIYPKE